MTKTLGEALRDPVVASELNKYFGGDATKLEPAAKSGDIKAQQLRTKIFSIMSGAEPSTSIVTSLTKTTTPKMVVQTPATVSPIKQPITQPAQQPALPTGGTSAEKASLVQPQTQTFQRSALDTGELTGARTAMEQARTSYVGAETEGMDFESRLRDAIQKKADFFKSLNEKKGNIISDLRTSDSRIREQYPELREDPFAVRKLMEQERGSLEKNLSQVNAELKQRQGYLDDIISAGVKAEQARIKVSELNYKAKKEAYDDLYDRTKAMVDYMDKNYEGPEVEKYKRDFLSMLGYSGVDSKNALVIDSAIGVKDGEKGGQCGKFVNDLTGLKVGDSYESKLAKMDPTIKTPEPGMVFTMPLKNSSYGHIGFIVSIKDGIATVKDSNWDKDEKVKTHQIPVSQMTGFQKVESKTSGLTPKIANLSTTQLKEKARNIVSNGKARGLSRKEVERALLELDISPNSEYYLALLNDLYGKKPAEPPADLQEEAAVIAEEIKNNDTQWVTLDADGEFKAIKWSSIPIAYRDRVKKLVELNKTATPTYTTLRQKAEGIFKR